MYHDAVPCSCSGDLDRSFSIRLFARSAKVVLQRRGTGARCGECSTASLPAVALDSSSSARTVWLPAGCSLPLHLRRMTPIDQPDPQQ